MNCGMPEGYNKVSELGKGGMGEVFLVEDRNEDNIRRALKIDDFIYIKNEYDCIKKMEGEQSSNSDYNDINILRAYNYGYVSESVEDIEEQNMDKRPGYIVMDYINGSNLSKISIGFDDDAVINKFMQTIFYQIARVVDMMHSMDPPLYHCDIKPTNIMVDDQNNAYLIDFGISTTDKEQSTKSWWGTNYYTPIQYIIYENSKVTDVLFRYDYNEPLYDHDIYSIMVSIVEMLGVFRYYLGRYERAINIDTCIINHDGWIEKISNPSFFNADKLINILEENGSPIERFPLLKGLLFSIMYAMPECGAIATDFGECNNRDIPDGITPDGITLIKNIKDLLENPWIQAGNQR
jgi:serine/threonine protein kinase